MKGRVREVLEHQKVCEVINDNTGGTNESEENAERSNRLLAWRSEGGEGNVVDDFFRGRRGEKRKEPPAA